MNSLTVFLHVQDSALETWIANVLREEGRMIVALDVGDQHPTAELSRTIHGYPGALPKID